MLKEGDKMVELNWKKDFEKSCEIIENPDLFSEDYMHYSKIFNFRTINHKELYVKMKAKWKKYLGVLASTNPMLNAVSMGCKNITVFDINLLNIYFMYLSIAAVLALDYQEFLEFFYSIEFDKYYGKHYFEKMKKELPSDVLKYWENLYKKYPKEKLVNLFYYPVIDQKNSKGVQIDVIPSNIFLEEKEFYRLKKELLEIKLRYFVEDFGNIPTLLKGEKFDTIYLSCMQNLIYDNIDGYNYFEKLKEYDYLLAKGGVIQGGYLYNGLDTDDEKWCSYNLKHFEENGYQKENINIIPGKDYGEYHLAFIKKKHNEI